jgi:5-methylcytosine-specific restriction endonuclease McrA
MSTPEQRAKNRAWQAAYVARNRDRVNELRRRRRAVTKPWSSRAAHAAKFAFQANLRAARWSAPGRLSATDVRKLDGPCAYCGGDARGWDHVEPLVLGGANRIENIVSCCMPCNRRKARRTPAQAGMCVQSAVA